MRSPLGSEERGVGWPRIVVGEAAHMASTELQYTIPDVDCGHAVPDNIDMADGASSSPKG